MPKKIPSKTKNKSDKINILDKINSNDALVILKILCKEDMNIAKRIEQIVREYLSEVDIDDIASEVYFDLDNIEVEEVWDRSGSTRDGYIDPGDMAWQMFEEALDPYLEELKKYQNFSMHNEAKKYCVGILKGIYQFEKKSKSEYKVWAEDAPGEYFGQVLSEWKKGCKNSKDIEEMEEFVKKNFPDW